MSDRSAAAVHREEGKYEMLEITVLAFCRLNLQPESLLSELLSVSEKCE